MNTSLTDSQIAIFFVGSNLAPSITFMEVAKYINRKLMVPSCSYCWDKEISILH